MTGRLAAAACLSVGLLAAAAAASAQDGWFGRRPPVVDSSNVEYDGRLVFARIRYSTAFSGYGRRGSRDPGWAHDYPTADLNLMQILQELTIASPRVDGSNVLTLDDPQLFRYPIAYMSEPGFWGPSESEAKGLRSYLLKGGFIIFDDFRGGDWYNVEEQMRVVLPEHRFIQLDVTHPVFHSFFDIQALDLLTSYNGLPTYYGIFENNDPRKRMMVIANRDGDLGEYWEYSGSGVNPVDLSNEAFKYGVNYFMYALTH